MYKLASRLAVIFAMTWAIGAGSAQAQSLSISYRGTLLTIRCQNASLEQVFEQIKSETGMELILEDPVKSKRITADIDSQPLHLAVERLLAGIGVNYAMMYDREDWQQVAKLFIGEGGGPLASSQPAAAGNARRPVRRAQPIEDNYDPTEEFEDGFGEEETLEDDFAEDESGYDESEAAEDPDDGVIDEPAGQDFVPPPPAFPRSRFTPGLETSPFGTNQQQPAGGTNTPSRSRAPARPPAYYPFTDQFGRPIPVPPDPNSPDAQGDEETPADQQ